MKSSIGTLAALAAFASPALAIMDTSVPASFENVPLVFSEPAAIQFDIDGDGTSDFSVQELLFRNSAPSGLRFNVSEGNFYALHLNYGDRFQFEDATESEPGLLPFDNIIYVGLSFVAGNSGQSYLGWVQIDTSYYAPRVVDGGWQPDLAGRLHIGIADGTPIPEPASAAALVGVSLLTGLAVRRRRRS
jgi:hypothetical protein